MNDQSTPPCGCDQGAGWQCKMHANMGQGIFSREINATVQGTARKAVQQENRELIAAARGETRVIDPKTGGEKGAKVARFSLIPSEFLWALATHYGVGARKYDDRNWERGYKWSLSLDALQRHLHQWLLGENNDQETGTNHLIAVAWHACALFIFQKRGLGTEDIRRSE